MMWKRGRLIATGVLCAGVVVALTACSSESRGVAPVYVEGASASSIVFSPVLVTQEERRPLWEGWEYARNDGQVSPGVDSRLAGVRWPTYEQVPEYWRLPPIWSRWGRSY
ncbi:MAG: hypothetical protein AB7G17_01435 [Phycisphaerales bacterium]